MIRSPLTMELFELEEVLLLFLKLEQHIPLGREQFIYYITSRGFTHLLYKEHVMVNSKVLPHLNQRNCNKTSLNDVKETKRVQDIHGNTFKIFFVITYNWVQKVKRVRLFPIRTHIGPHK